MSEERYPGEARGLRLFLTGVLSAVEAKLGHDALLYHRIRAALERSDLQALRDARQMFNHQDTDLKRRLSLAGTRREGLHLVDRRDAHDMTSATVVRLHPPVAPGPRAE